MGRLRVLPCSTWLGPGDWTRRYWSRGRFVTDSITGQTLVGVPRNLLQVVTEALLILSLRRSAKRL